MLLWSSTSRPLGPFFPQNGAEAEADDRQQKAGASLQRSPSQLSGPQALVAAPEPTLGLYLPANTLPHPKAGNATFPEITRSVVFQGLGMSQASDPSNKV